MMRRRGGLVRGVARTAVVAGTATAVSGRVHPPAEQQVGGAGAGPVRAAGGRSSRLHAPPPAPAPAADDDMAELQQLAELHAQGILTDEEFAAKKAQILGI